MSPEKKKALDLLFIVDPLASFDPVAETTMYMMREARRRGHRVFATQPRWISAQGSRVFGPAASVQVAPAGQNPWFQIGETETRDFASMDAILLRKDPPFDLDYLHHLYLLELIAARRYMMNHPAGILKINEKVFPLPLTDKVPETLISSDQQALLNFIQDHPQGVIIKPLGSAGGKGVFLLRHKNSDNLGVILETATDQFSRHVVAQAYRPEIEQGDKRILLLGQEVLGAFLRKPKEGEHRANLHAGGKCHPAEVSRRQLEIIQFLKPQLKELGLDFVGLDFIGDYLIEINVTSPMGLHEVNQTQGIQSESAVLDYLEKRVKEFL